MSLAIQNDLTTLWFGHIFSFETAMNMKVHQCAYFVFISLRHRTSAMRTGRERGRRAGGGPVPADADLGANVRIPVAQDVTREAN